MLSRRTASGAIQESDVAKAKWICIVNFAARRRLRPGLVERGRLGGHSEARWVHLRRRALCTKYTKPTLSYLSRSYNFALPLQAYNIIHIPLVVYVVLCVVLVIVARYDHFESA